MRVLLPLEIENREEKEVEDWKIVEEEMEEMEEGQ